MAITTLYFQSIDVPIAIGDLAYYCIISADGVALNEPTLIGTIVEIDLDDMYITIDANSGIVVTNGMFILFSKPVQVEESSLKGYYANVTFENASKTYAELFAISSETVISSK